jgi:hypothetical protein
VHEHVCLICMYISISVRIFISYLESITQVLHLALDNRECECVKYV